MTPEADEAGGGWEGEEVLDDVLLVVAARCVEAREAAQVFLEEERIPACLDERLRDREVPFSAR